MSYRHINSAFIVAMSVYCIVSKRSTRKIDQFRRVRKQFAIALRGVAKQKMNLNTRRVCLGGKTTISSQLTASKRNKIVASPSYSPPTAYSLTFRSIHILRGRRRLRRVHWTAVVFDFALPTAVVFDFALPTAVVFDFALPASPDKLYFRKRNAARIDYRAMFSRQISVRQIIFTESVFRRVGGPIIIGCRRRNAKATARTHLSVNIAHSSEKRCQKVAHESKRSK